MHFRWPAKRVARKAAGLDLPCQKSRASATVCFRRAAQAWPCSVGCRKCCLDTGVPNKRALGGAGRANVVAMLSSRGGHVASAQGARASDVWSAGARRPVVAGGVCVCCVCVCCVCVCVSVSASAPPRAAAAPARRSLRCINRA
eukprot:15413037-Alexandrium_andersonii.AAC.2